MSRRKPKPSRTAAYAAIIEQIFLSHYRSGAREVAFEREEIATVARKLGLPRPKNLGDVVYSFRYRRRLPDSIRKKAPAGERWIIRPAGKARYCFELVPEGAAEIRPNPQMAEIKVPDSTPGLIAKYALTDEQALLAVLRYNRLIDVFTGVTCYSLQNHLRTQVSGIGQVETDELYIGVDRTGSHFVLPIQAKGGSDVLSVVQIEQDMALCAEKFSNLVCRPVAAQFMERDLIALFEFIQEEGRVAIHSEKHFRLVASDEIDEDDLRRYRERLVEAPQA